MAGKKQRWIYAAAVAGGLAVLGGLLYKQHRENEMLAISRTQAAAPLEDSIIWKECSYRYNEYLSNFLFLGIDKDTVAKTKVGSADAGQADALFLISWDRVRNTITKISIPRDTMTDIEAFQADGKSLGKTRDHISLAYGFGDGEHRSCELSREAVSNLLYGVPIQGYCAVSLDALPVLMEHTGQMEVTVPNASLENVSYEEGERLTLDEENVETFVRYRDTEEAQSALGRLERQEVFLSAYGEKMKEKMEEDRGFVTDLYEALKPYMVTNMDAGQFLDLAECAMQEDFAGEWTIPGEGTQGKSYDEYQVDDQALYERVIASFYVEDETS